MKVVYEYSHLGGSEILKVHYPEIEGEIYSAIESVKARHIKESKEKTKQGRMLFSPIDMNQQFLQVFRYLAMKNYETLIQSKFQIAK
jgi:hypothetical protein